MANFFFLGLSAIILIWPQIKVSAEFMVLILIFIWIKFIDFLKRKVGWEVKSQ